MPSTNSFPATDSAEELRPILGGDATATFEDDPTFVESNPTGTASSENVAVQKLSSAKATPDDDDTEDEEDEEDDLDEEDDEDDEEYEDEEDDDEGDLEDEEEDDDLEDEDDDDEEDEDDADEVKASSVLRADGLLGYEDEADDAKDGKSRAEGDKERAEAEEEVNDGEKNYDPYSHEDGKWLPVEKDDTPEEEGALLEHRDDDPNFIRPYRAAALPAAAGAALPGM